MNVTREELAAFADGELEAERSAEIEGLLTTNPEMAREVEAHRALRERLTAHYAPHLDDPVPDQLRVLLERENGNNVVDLAKRKASRSARRGGIPRWSWAIGPALAACLVLAFFIRSEPDPRDYVGRQVAAALDDRLVATQPADAPIHVLLSFRDRSGGYCRAYTEAKRGGIACRDTQGWRMMETIDGDRTGSGEYRQAGSVSARLMARVQDMANGPALDAEQELVASSMRWQAQ